MVRCKMPAKKSSHPFALLSIGLLLAMVQASTAASGGLPLWTNTYNGPGNYRDEATGIAVGKHGDVYVTGRSRGDSGNDDYATIAYSNSGVPLWTNRFGRSGNDVAWAITADGRGKIFVTGSSEDSDSHADFATVCYSEGGSSLWTNIYAGPGTSPNDADVAGLVAVNASGTVFVSGMSMGSQAYDYATIAYSNSGEALWTNRFSGLGYSGDGSGNDKPNAIAVDGAGNVFVTGFSENPSGLSYATVAYSASSGVPLWTNLYEGYYFFATAIACDTAGNIFVTGWSITTNGPHECVTLAYSNSGLPIWTNRFSSEGRALVVTPEGNVIVSGVRGIFGQDSDCLDVAYSNAGLPLWTNVYNGPGNAADAVYRSVIDYSGNLIVAGYSNGGKPDTTGYDYVTLAYSNSGIPLWTNRYDGAGHGWDQASALAVDRSGNVFVTGFALGSWDRDFVTIKYSSSALPVPLNFKAYNGKLILEWTNSNFLLRGSASLDAPFTNLIGALSPYTNIIAGPAFYFRLALP
jgi:hypothetical protein